MLVAAILFCARGFAQDLNSMPASSSEQWQVFVDETESPLLPGASLFNAATSQWTRSVPHYGGEAGGFAKRFVASAADDTVQNFVGDYVMGSLFHEDTRYRREGPGHSFFRRVAHAAMSGLVTRNFSGNRTINWSNIAGSAIGAAASNLYYPAMDRNSSVAISNFAQNVIGGGLGNLAPEFWPDFHDWLARHHLMPSRFR